MSKGWHIQRDGDVWTLSRQQNPRFDVFAETALPDGHPIRLMHQIRQDVWRVLQRVRGFTPVVRLTALGQGWTVQAGGNAPRLARLHQTQVQELLEDPRYRARWMMHAQRCTQQFGGI